MESEWNVSKERVGRELVWEGSELGESWESEWGVRRAIAESEWGVSGKREGSWEV